VFILPSGAKKNGKIVSDYFAVDLVIFLPQFGKWTLPHLDVNVAVNFAQILNIFCPNNGQFFSVGDATASPCRTLMLTVLV